MYWYLKVFGISDCRYIRYKIVGYVMRQVVIPHTPSPFIRSRITRPVCRLLMCNANEIFCLLVPLKADAPLGE